MIRYTKVILPVVKPLISGSAILVNILSMIALLLPLTRVGIRIWGCKQFGDESFINLFLCSEESNISGSILKSPRRKTFLSFIFIFLKED